MLYICLLLWSGIKSSEVLWKFCHVTKQFKLQNFKLLFCFFRQMLDFNFSAVIHHNTEVIQTGGRDPKMGRDYKLYFWWVALHV